ncbi:MAG: LysR family transcriptional regulator [Octadecabacter sp.]
MRINYDFGDLEAFLAIQQTGSFHGAAQALGLSQSAITRRLQKLEDALGTTLFERTTRRLKPTLAAKRLKARAEAILDDAHETAQAMRDENVAYAQQRSAVITLATIPTVIARLVVPAIRAFRASGETARIRILDGTAIEVAAHVATGEADFGLSSVTTPEPSTKFDPIYDDRMVIALPLAHPLAGAGSIGLDALHDTPLILPARDTVNRLLIDEAMAAARIVLNWTFEVGRANTSLEMVADGLGAALVPHSAIGAGRLAVCELDNLTISRPVGVLSRIGQQDGAAVTPFKAAIRTVAASLESVE